MSNCNLIQTISGDECIGASRHKINNNFINLDTTACTLSGNVDSLKTTVTALVTASNFFTDVMNIRMSLHQTNPVHTNDIKNATTLYVHPYKGNKVVLYNTTTQKWELRTFSTPLQVGLGPLITANTNYDIFLYYDNGYDIFAINFEPWANQTTPASLTLLDGIPVKAGSPNARFIGCLRTTSIGQTEVSFGHTPVPGGSHPKIFLWNYYNQVPATFSINDNASQKWTSTASGRNAANNGPFEQFGSSANNRVSFITREPVRIDLSSTHYNSGATCLYFAYSLNVAAPTVSQILANTPGTSIWESCQVGQVMYSNTYTINPGYNFFQIVTMTYATKPLAEIWRWSPVNDRHVYGTRGSILSY